MKGSSCSFGVGVGPLGLSSMRWRSQLHTLRLTSSPLIAQFPGRVVDYTRVRRVYLSELCNMSDATIGCNALEHVKGDGWRDSCHTFRRSAGGRESKSSSGPMSTRIVLRSFVMRAPFVGLFRPPRSQLAYKAFGEGGGEEEEEEGGGWMSSKWLSNRRLDAREGLEGLILRMELGEMCDPSVAAIRTDLQQVFPQWLGATNAKAAKGGLSQ